MTSDHAVQLARDAVALTLLLGAPTLLAAVVVGLVVSILQAVTQIQDQTISFVPKIVVMLLTALLLLPWMIHRMVEYATTLIGDIPTRL